MYRAYLFASAFGKMLVAQINLFDLLHTRSGTSEWGEIEVKASNMSTSIDEIFLLIEAVYPGVTFKVQWFVLATNRRVGDGHPLYSDTSPEIQRN